MIFFASFFRSLAFLYFTLQAASVRTGMRIFLLSLLLMFIMRFSTVGLQSVAIPLSW
jgi:hypothetical protein